MGEGPRGAGWGCRAQGPLRAPFRHRDQVERCELRPTCCSSFGGLPRRWPAEAGVRRSAPHSCRREPASPMSLRQRSLSCGRARRAPVTSRRAPATARRGLPAPLVALITAPSAARQWRDAPAPQPPDPASLLGLPVCAWFLPPSQGLSPTGLNLYIPVWLLRTRNGDLKTPEGGLNRFPITDLRSKVLKISPKFNLKSSIPTPIYFPFPWF